MLHLIAGARVAMVRMINPRTIRIGGTLASAHDYLIAGVRELVYQRCLPLATRRPIIQLAPPVETACLIGATISPRSHLFIGSRVGQLLERFQTHLSAHSRSRVAG